MPALTLSMIVKNEEGYLKDCLDSVHNLTDEIVIVDTGSTDKTVEIANEYGAKVFHFDWINDFSAARNFALQKSSGNWILYLDADERLCTGSIDKIKEIIKTGRKEGYRCIVNSPDDFGGKPNLMRYTRFFYNNGEIAFKGAIHEQIDESLLQQGYKLIDSDIEILHIGYNVSKDSIKLKAERNLELLLTEFSKNNSSYYAYQLGNTYSILQDDENARKFYKLALTDEKLYNGYKVICYLYLAGSELENHRPAEALNFAAKGINIDRTHPLLNLVASQIYIRLNNASAGIKLCRIALEQNRKNSNKRDYSILTVIVSAKQIVYQGIFTSLLAGSKPDVEFFIKELDRILSNKDELLFIKKLYHNENISDEEITRFIPFIDEYSFETILFLIEQYSFKKAALQFLTKIKDKYPDNTKFLTKLGLIYLDNDLNDNAVQVLEESLNYKEKDPAAVFYLISAYIKINQWGKIPDLIKLSEDEFSSIPEFNSKLAILKTKLQPYLNK